MFELASFHGWPYILGTLMYSGMLMELYWAWQHHHKNQLHWSDQKSLVRIEEETKKVTSQSAVSLAQCTCSHIIWRTGCHPKCWIWTTSFSDYYLFSKLKEFIKGSKFFCWWRCYQHSKWPAWAWSTILLQCNSSFGEMLNQVHFSCRRLWWKVTKYDVSITLLTMSFYKLFECPSYG